MAQTHTHTCARMHAHTHAQTSRTSTVSNSVGYEGVRFGGAKPATAPTALGTAQPHTHSHSYTSSERRTGFFGSISTIKANTRTEKQSLKSSEIDRQEQTHTHMNTHTHTTQHNTTQRNNERNKRKHIQAVKQTVIANKQSNKHSDTLTRGAQNLGSAGKLPTCEKEGANTN